MPDPAPKFPFRRLMLMPWRWSRWTWLAIVLASPAVYFISAPAIDYAALVPHERGYDDDYIVWRALRWISRPALWCCGKSETLADIYDWEWRFLNTTFGEIKLTVSTAPAFDSLR